MTSSRPPRDEQVAGADDFSFSREHEFLLPEPATLRAPSAPTGLAARGQPQVSAAEAAAPAIHVVIGKITVQANGPGTPAPPPARAVAPAGPRLSLEQYLLRRRGAG